MQLHPAIVHFPIALLCMAAVLRVILLWSVRPWIEAALRLCLWTGTLTLAAAVLSGQSSIPSELPQGPAIVLEKHQRLGFTLLLWYGFLSLWELARSGRIRRGERVILVIAHLAGVTLLLLTALYGGILVYDFGVGTKVFPRVAE